MYGYVAPSTKVSSHGTLVPDLHARTKSFELTYIYKRKLMLIVRVHVLAGLNLIRAWDSALLYQSGCKLR